MDLRIAEGLANCKYLAVYKGKQGTLLTNTPDIMPEEMTMARQEALPPVAVHDELPDFGPVSPNDLAVRASTSGAYDIHIPLHLSPQLAEQAVAAIRATQEMGATVIKLEAESRALEAKSRALRNIMVPVIAAITLVWLVRRSPA